MGTTVDDQRRADIRKDDARIEASIKRSRQQIFERGNGPDTVPVCSELEDKSLTPIMVRVGFSYME